MTLPNFIIGGVPKGGTTSLDYYLGQHPEVYMARKEPRYFMFDPEDRDPNGKYDNITVRTRAQYEALFDGVTTEKAIGEATPFYMLSPVAIRRMPVELPDIKLIFSLREPIARAYSAYWMNVRQGKETLPVHEALTEDSFYVRAGCYSSYLAGWYRAYDPSRISVVLFDDLKSTPLPVIQGICRFLEVGDEFSPDLTVRNKGQMPKNLTLARLNAQLRNNPVTMALYKSLPTQLREAVVGARDKNLQDIPPIPEDIVRHLSAFYHDEISRLEEILKRDLSAWRRG